MVLPPTLFNHAAHNEDATGVPDTSNNTEPAKIHVVLNRPAEIEERMQASDQGMTHLGVKPSEPVEPRTDRHADGMRPADLRRTAWAKSAAKFWRCQRPVPADTLAMARRVVE